jgi:hypothetical protein
MDNKKITYDDPYLRKGIYVNDEIYNQENHNLFLSLLNQQESFDGDQYIVSSIKSKISSYKSQDKKSRKFDPDQFICYDELLEMLIESNLKCFYCDCDLLLVYKNKKETKQWSLERLDNNLGHYKSNTCISCLSCNLQRRTSNYEYFKFGKSLCVKKSN